MVSIVPADEALRAELLGLVGITGDGAACLVAKNRDRLCGYAAYRLTEHTAELLAAEADDSLLADGLIRAALHAVREQGAVTACCRQPNLYPLLGALGFAPEQAEDSGCADGLYAVIETALKGHCG